jgi:drug/metabolite transporter (DMT)-like permease
MSRDWWSKSLAGVLLGFVLSILASGLFAWLTPGGPGASNKFQATMWVTAPVWASILSAVYFFRSGAQAWRWLGGATVLATAALLACRHYLD